MVVVCFAGEGGARVAITSCGKERKKEQAQGAGGTKELRG
jgi:hypothetical protein